MNLSDEIIAQAKAEGWFIDGDHWVKYHKNADTWQQWHPVHGYNFGTGPFPQPEPLTAEKARAQVREHLAEAKEEMRKQPITQPAAEASDGWDYLQKFARTCQQINAGTHVAVPRELVGQVAVDLRILETHIVMGSPLAMEVASHIAALEAILKEGEG